MPEAPYVEVTPAQGYVAGKQLFQDVRDGKFTLMLRTDLACAGNVLTSASLALAKDRPIVGALPDSAEHKEFRTFLSAQLQECEEKRAVAATGTDAQSIALAAFWEKLIAILKLLLA